MEADWIPIVLFLVIGTCVGLALYFRFRSRQEMQLTVRSIVDSGQSMSPDALKELTEALFPPRSDLRRGVIFLAIGVATIAFAYLVDEGDAVGPLIGISAFPFLVGFAYIGLALMNNDKGTPRG